MDDKLEHEGRLEIEHSKAESNGSDDVVPKDEGDGKVEWTLRRAVATISLSALWTGSQIPLYFVGGCLSYITMDIGGTAAMAWLPVSNTLALAATSPFIGYLQDLFGRRYITLFGSLLLMIGILVTGTAHSFGQGVAGMAIAGSGAGIGELTALAGTSELVPVRLRAAYIGLIICFLIPITPYVLYTQLLASRSTWRWIMWISLIYNGIAFIGIALFYFPVRIEKLSRGTAKAVLKQVDYIGGLLSIVGVTLFLVALQSGGYTHPWSSAYVLAPLIIGILLVISFGIWEWKLAKHPYVPREMFRGRKAVGWSFIVAFVAGMNFYSLINFFPLTFATVYNPDPVQVGLKGLGYGISVTAGAAIFNFLMSWFPGWHRELLMTACTIMTAFGGALAAVTPENPKTCVALGTIAGFGVGGILVPAQTIAITACPDSVIGTATALSLAFRVVGGSIGYAIYYNIFKEKLTTNLPAYIATYALEAGLPMDQLETFVGGFATVGPSAVESLPGVTPAIIAAAAKGSQWGYAESFKYVWYTSIAFGIVSIVACFFIGNTRKYMTNRIAAKIAS